MTDLHQMTLAKLADYIMKLDVRARNAYILANDAFRAYERNADLTQYDELVRPYDEAARAAEAELLAAKTAYHSHPAWAEINARFEAAGYNAPAPKQVVATGKVAPKLTILTGVTPDMIDAYLAEYNDLAATQDAASYRNQ